MTLQQPSDRTLLAEIASAISYILVAFIMLADNMNSASNNSYFSVIMLCICGFLQSLSLVFRTDLVLLRICMAWISASVWTWLTYMSYSHPLHIMAFVIGMCNMYAFVYMTNRASIDWVKYFEKDSHDHVAY